MSIEAVAAVLNMEVKDSTAKLVLIGLANHANQSGECWPSQALLAVYASCTRQTVNRKIRWLEEHDFIETEQSFTRGKMKSVKHYILALPDVAKADSVVTTSRQQLSHCGDIEPSIEPSRVSLSGARASATDLSGFQVDDELTRWFDANAPNVEPHALLEELRLYCESTGKTYANYRATLKRWALREKGKTNEQRIGATKRSPHRGMQAGFERALEIVGNG